MSTYRVYLNTGASATITVEADSEDEAIEAAYALMPRDVCAQCGGWGQSWSLDLGEWELDDGEAVTEVES